MRFCVRIFVRIFVRFLMEPFVRSSLGAALTPILTNLDRAKAWDQVSLARSAARSVFYSVGIRKCHAEQSGVSAKVLGLGRFGTPMRPLFLNRSRTRKDTLPSAQRDTSYGRRSYGQALPLILPTSWLVS